MCVCTWRHSKTELFFFFLFVVSCYHSIFVHLIDYTRFVFFYFKLVKWKPAELCVGFGKGCLRKMSLHLGFFPSSEMTLNLCWLRSSLKGRGKGFLSTTDVLCKTGDFKCGCSLETRTSDKMVRMKETQVFDSSHHNLMLQFVKDL